MIKATAPVAQRLQFGWQKAVSRFFPEGGRTYKDMDAKLDSLWREVYAAPTEVKPIDFAQWAGKIQNKAEFEAIKKEYESKKFAAPVADVYQTEAELKTAVENAKKASEFSQIFAKKLEAELAANEKQKSEWYFYNQEQLFALVPNFEAELARYREDLNPLLPESVTAALNTISPAEIVSSLNAGKLPAFPVQALAAFPTGVSPVRDAINKEFEAFRAEAKGHNVATKSLDEIIAGAGGKTTVVAAH